MAAVMKKSLRSLLVPLACAAFALSAPPARAGWFSSEKSDLLDKADAEYAAAAAAAKNYEIVTQLTELRKALGTYRQLEQQYPDYYPEKVNDRIREIVFTLGAIDERIRRGELALPAAELSGAARPAPATAPAAQGEKKPAEPGAPAFRRPIPALVRTENDPRPETAAPQDASRETAASQVPAPSWMDETIPNPLYAQASRERGESVPAPVPARTGPVPEDPARLARFAAAIRENRASDAVMELEDLIESEGAAASVGTRAMFARALLACGNYARAADELASIPPSADGDPAVLTLRVASAVGLGDLPRALLLLDRLVTAFPDYSDAYVDFAYVRFLSDPGNPEARDEAVVYYRQALMRGARRDMRLEEELGLRVE